MTMPSAIDDLAHPVPRWPRRLRSAAAIGLIVAAAAAGLIGVRQMASRRIPEPMPAGWTRAQGLLAAHDFHHAREALEEFLATCPLHGEGHFLAARTCRRAGDEEGWRTHLHAAEVLQWPARDIEFENLLMEAQIGNLRLVEPALVRLVEAHAPEEGLIIEALVRGYLQTFRLEEVRSWCEQWAHLEPANDLPWLYQARAYFLNRFPRQAIAQFERALELNPQLAEAHLGAAEAYAIETQFPEALPHYRAYVQARPDDPAGLLGAANCQFSQGDREAARTTLDELLGRFPNHAAGCLVRAKLELEDHRPAEALDWARKADALAPNETDITYTLALALRGLGRNAEAAACEQKLDALRKGLDQLDEVKKQIRRQPTNLALRHEAGVRALKLGREKEASRWFQSVLQQDADYAPTHRALAAYYRQQGDPERAAMHEAKAKP